MTITPDRTSTGAPLTDLAPSGVDRAARRTLDRAVAGLLERQHADGWWKAPLDTNVTMDAEDLMLRHVLGISDDGLTERTARWIRSQQRDDGTWATFHGGPGDVSTTAEAYVALRLAGDDPAAPHMRAAADFVRREGGLGSTRVFTRIWLALIGQWSWDRLPAMPPEVILLPPWAPLNIYDFACWARQTIVALTVVAAHRPSTPVPFSLDELRTGGDQRAHPFRRTSAVFEVLDRVLHAYEALPGTPLRRHALRRAEEWIVQRQEADGSWGGIQPPWVYSLMALRLQGYADDHPVMRAGLRGLDGFAIEDTVDGQPIRRMEACQSPVWDTALAVVALCDAGVPADHPAIERAAGWLLDQQVDVPGDWSVRRPDLAPGGWAFEFENDWYPDTDDTAEVAMALRRTDPTGDEVGGAVGRAVRWLEGMQSRNGGWAAFDVDNTRQLPTKLPFCDFGEVIDPPSADVTAHVVELLGQEPTSDPAVLGAGVRYLIDEQEEDGSWFGRWGCNHVYGTGAVVPALVAAGIPTSDPCIRRAVDWLVRHQNTDGGWGEDLRSYRDPAWRGRGESTPSQTAWALLALLAAGERDAAATVRGIRWLCDHQREDGDWDEEQFTGTGFPGDFSIKYQLYRSVFPVTALGRYLHAVPR